MIALWFALSLAAECPVYQVSIAGSVHEPTGELRLPMDEVARDVPRLVDMREPPRTGVIEVLAPPTTYTEIKVRCFYARATDPLRDGEAVVRVPKGSDCRVRVRGEGLKTLRARVVAYRPEQRVCLDVRRRR